MTPARRDINNIHLPNFAKLFNQKSRVLFVGVHYGFDKLYRSWFNGKFETLDILPVIKGVKPDIQGDITNCPQIKDNTYDGVVCIGLYEYELDQNKMVTEICRMLKPGGSALFCMPGPAYYKHHKMVIEPKDVFFYLKPMRVLSMHITYYRSDKAYYVHVVAKK